MHKALNRNLYLVKEHVGLFKAANNYDIYDPQTGGQILQCREDRLGFFTKLLRFTNYKRYTPFDIEVRPPNGPPVLHVRRGIAIFLSKVVVHNGDENGTVLGGFKEKLFSVGGAFNVLDANDKQICHLKGKWTTWDFRFLAGEKELARVSKKWMGIGKELFTTADNYMLEINPSVPPDSSIRQLILAAVLCIDMVMKE